MAVETEYKVVFEDSGQELTLTRWAFGELCQLDADMELLNFGNGAGQPPPTRRENQTAFHTIVLATTKCQTYDELVNKYLGKTRTLANLTHLGNEIIRHERLDWLRSRGWTQVQIDQYFDAEGNWKPVEAVAKPQEGNGKPSPLGKKRSADATAPIS